MLDATDKWYTNNMDSGLTNAILYTLCIMPSSRSGPGNESSKQGRWLNPKFIFAILCSFSSEYNPKQIFKVNFCQSDIPGAS